MIMLPLKLVSSALAVGAHWFLKWLIFFLGDGYNFLVWGPPSSFFAGPCGPLCHLLWRWLQLLPFVSPGHSPHHLQPQSLFQASCAELTVFPCKLSPCDLVTVVRVYGEELYCPLFGLAEQQVRASSGSIFNLHPLSPLKILRSQLDWLSESFGFLKDVILGSPRHPVNQALSGWLGKLYFPRLPMIGCIGEPLF